MQANLINRLFGNFKVTRATRTSLREALRTPGFGLVDTLHGYIYGRWPYFYIGIATGEHRLVRLMRPLINVFFNALNGFPADKCRPVSTAEVIAILKVEAQRGHVHHAFFKEAALGRFFAICNCCSCCCGAMQAHRNGIPMLASSGYVSVVDDEQCVGCGTCVDHCPFGAIRLADSKARVDAQACMGCGVCESICPQTALTLQRDHTRSQPLEIDRLLN